jgi:phospholipase C
VAFEHVSLEQDLQRKPSRSARGGPIGLGYRVPLVIASPWSRGGAVCSQVFDHTSILQFLEKFVSHKTGKAIQETNISAWRRTVCGDLTAVFTPYNGEAIVTPVALSRDAFVERIHKAQFKQVPSGFRALMAGEIAQINRGASSILPAQEKGTRTARPLPYELYADGQLANDKRSFQLKLTASNTVFGGRASGAPFCVYNGTDQGDIRHYAVKAGDTLTDSWGELREGRYHVMLHGPDGFFRVFRGSVNDPLLTVSCSYPKAKGSLAGNIELTMVNRSNATLNVTVKDNAYKQNDQFRTIAPGATVSLVVALAKSSGWYDTSVLIREADAFEARFAGKVETGKEGNHRSGYGKRSLNLAAQNFFVTRRVLMP